MKRGTDHVWETVRYRGDVEIYAICKCGFFYGVSLDEREDGVWVFPRRLDERKLYRYCPWCGARKTRYTLEVRKIDKFPPWMDYRNEDI